MEAAISRKTEFGMRSGMEYVWGIIAQNFGDLPKIYIYAGARRRRVPDTCPGCKEDILDMYEVFFRREDA